MRSRKRKDGRHENDDSASEHTTDNRLQMLAVLCQMITSKLMLAWNGFGYIKTAEVLTVVTYLYMRANISGSPTARGDNDTCCQPARASAGFWL